MILFPTLTALPSTSIIIISPSLKATFVRTPAPIAIEQSVALACVIVKKSAASCAVWVLKVLSNGLVTESYLTWAVHVTVNSGALANAANPVAATPEYTAGLSTVTLNPDKTVDAILYIVVAPVKVAIDIWEDE